jgi:hypothetical protein
MNSARKTIRTLAEGVEPAPAYVPTAALDQPIEPEVQLVPDKPAAIKASTVPSPRARKKPAVPEAQPMASQATLTDFGLYKCEVCGKMVLGFDCENHVQEAHRGKSVEWKKIK